MIDSPTLTEAIQIHSPGSPVTGEQFEELERTLNDLMEEEGVSDLSSMLNELLSPRRPKKKRRKNKSNPEPKIPKKSPPRSPPKSLKARMQR